MWQVYVMTWHDRYDIDRFVINVPSDAGKDREIGCRWNNPVLLRLYWLYIVRCTNGKWSTTLFFSSSILFDRNQFGSLRRWILMVLKDSLTRWWAILFHFLESRFNRAEGRYGPSCRCDEGSENGGESLDKQSERIPLRIYDDWGRGIKAAVAVERKP